MSIYITETAESGKEAEAIRNKSLMNALSVKIGLHGKDLVNSEDIFHTRESLFSIKHPANTKKSLHL